MSKFSHLLKTHNKDDEESNEDEEEGSGNDSNEDEDEDGEEDSQGEGSEDEDEEDVQDGLQTFVFSATLSKDLQRNLKKRKAPGKSRKPRAAPASTLGKCATNFLSWLDERLGSRLAGPLHGPAGGTLVCLFNDPAFSTRASGRIWHSRWVVARSLGVADRPLLFTA